MKFVFASDSFKGTLSSEHIHSLLERAAKESFPTAECVSVTMADGGEGTLDALRSVRSGESISLYVHNGLMRPMRCEILIDGDEAFVETASTCGLSLLNVRERNPLLTSSFGVGECISHALAHKCGEVTIGLGGSCTNDGGMGCLRALGVRFYDCEGNELAGRGLDLERVARIDESGLYAPARTASFVIMSDVTNSLLGPNGATYTFGRQKGADDEALARLEAGMSHFADVIAETHPDVDFATPGYGAAGGLGMALSVFLGAQMSSGIETLLQWVDFDNVIAGADLIVTGEGRLDWQSLQGKVLDGIVSHAKKAQVPVAVICGNAALDTVQLQGLKLARLVETSRGQALEQAMVHAEENYLTAARELFASL